jgi:uncharacterized membrane protein
MTKLRSRKLMRWAMAALYFGAGLVHVTSPDAFLPIVPDWVPWPRIVVLVTGMCELAGAIGLFLPLFRRSAGIALALYAICVFPANIKHAMDHVQIAGIPDSWWYHAPRLALQPVLVWWALFCTGVTDWPWNRPSEKP